MSTLVCTGLCSSKQQYISSDPVRCIFDFIFYCFRGSLLNSRWCHNFCPKFVFFCGWWLIIECQNVQNDLFSLHCSNQCSDRWSCVIHSINKTMNVFATISNRFQGLSTEFRYIQVSRGMHNSVSLYYIPGYACVVYCC